MEKSNAKGGFIVPGWGLVIFFILTVLIFAANAPAQNAMNWQWVLMSGPVWMPIVFGRFALMRFMQMRQSKFNNQNPMIILELRIPREIAKSPQAMEAVFSQMHINPGEGTWLKKYWWGRTRPWWSFEIVSIGGTVRFFVATRASMRPLVETAFYAQYPEIELIEAVDYSRLRDPSYPPYQMFACEYEHTKPDPYPIRTYVDYGIDKPGIKPEEQVDPFAQILEVMGSLKTDEQLWMQIVFRVAKSEKWRGKKNAKGKPYTWLDETKRIVDEIKKNTQSKAVYLDPQTGQLRESAYPDLTDVKKEDVKAIERNAGKPAFDVGIRSIYSGPANNFRALMPFVAMIFKAFNSERSNGIMPAPHWSEKFNDYPWEDIGGHRQRHEMHEVVEFFRGRYFFHPPYRGHWMIMSSEELASIFHVPSSTVKTPSVPRIQSTTAAPPPNLPQ